ncbi:hypothetical protein [Sphingomonas bacterium]|uniref:hypothetical protein n=1 Tax=Sphingomonas bacterium TaxID=1895847 RepID=UPI0015751CF2|nr:hypothetical protein [Sphingomonas bacterium]
MRPFERFVAIDWSGAVGERQRGIALAECRPGLSAPVLTTPVAGVWSRADICDWLMELAVAGSRTLVGLDLSPSLPFEDAGAFFPGWDRSPLDAKALWAEVERLSADDPHLAASGVVDHPELRDHFRRRGRAAFAGRGRLRRCEQRQRLRRGLSPSSCFNLVGAAQVGKSSLTGMRVLHALGGRVPTWPFDPVPGDGPVIVEIYTAIAALDAGRPAGRAKMRDAVTLDAALAAIGSEPSGLAGPLDDHATDAILSAAWLRTRADDAALWTPDGLDAVAATEGWTFGVR